MSHKLLLWICLWLKLQYNAVMVHLLIAYQVLLIITAVAALILIQIGKNKITFLRPFYWSFLFFTLLILLDLSIIYFSSNISIKPSYAGFYGFVFVQSSLFYIFYIYLLLTLVKILKKSINFVFKIIIITAIVSLPLVVSPLSIVFSIDLQSIIFKRAYFIFMIPYMVLSFSSVFLVITEYKKILTKKKSPIYLSVLGLFSIICFLQALAAYIYKLNNPIISMKLDVNNRGFIESNLAFLVLSISTIVFITRRLTLKKRLPDLDTLISQGLTQREAELALLILNGLNNQEIADKLFISVSTVKTHINNIFRKCNTSARSDFVKRMEEL